MSIVLIIIIAVILILLLAFGLNYNKFVSLNNKVLESFSNMDVYLKKRIDLIPNLVEICKAYMKHEKDVLEGIISLRNKPYASMSVDKKIEHNSEISSKISNLLAVAENYPELKANQNFMNLSDTLKDIEKEIANSRISYNNIVNNFNTKVSLFPNVIFATILGFKKKKLFEITNDERQNVKVKF